MQEMGVSGNGTHDKARSVASDHVPDRDNSLPNVPTGTGGPKSD